jgi:hypothetical protein
LAAFERIDKHLPILWCGVPVDGQFDADTSTHLGAGTHCCCVDRFRLRDGGDGHGKEQCEQKAAVAEFPGSKTLDLAFYHCFFPFKI